MSAIVSHIGSEDIICLVAFKIIFLFPKCSLTKSDPETLFPTSGTSPSECSPPAAKQQSSWYWLKASWKLELRAECSCTSQVIAPKASHGLLLARIGHRNFRSFARGYQVDLRVSDCQWNEVSFVFSLCAWDLEAQLQRSG